MGNIEGGKNGRVEEYIGDRRLATADWLLLTVDWRLLTAYWLLIKDLFRMILRVHLLDNIFDLSVLVDEEGFAGGAHVFATVHRFLHPGTILGVNGLVGIGEEAEGELFFGNEFLVRLFGIGADSEHFVARLLQSFVVVAEIAGFGCAARCHVARIKIQYHLAATVVRKLNLFAILVGRGEVGSLDAGF